MVTKLFGGVLGGGVGGEAARGMDLVDEAVIGVVHRFLGVALSFKVQLSGLDVRVTNLVVIIRFGGSFGVFWGVNCPCIGIEMITGRVQNRTLHPRLDAKNTHGGNGIVGVTPG